MARPNAPTAPVWSPRYSPSAHSNERVTRRMVEVCCRGGGASGLATDGVALAPEHRVVGQRTVEQRGLDVAAATVLAGAAQGGEGAEHRERCCADAGEGEPWVHGAVAVRGLVGHARRARPERSPRSRGDRGRNPPRSRRSTRRPARGCVRGAPRSRGRAGRRRRGASSRRRPRPGRRVRAPGRAPRRSSRSSSTLRFPRFRTDACSGAHRRSGSPPGGSTHTTSAP